MPGRYYRALLYGGGVVVTLSILGAGLTGVEHLFEQYFVERQHVFLYQRDLVQASVDRYQARLKQTVEAYELLWNLHDHDDVPASRYRFELEKDHGAVTTGPDVTVSPFSVLSTLTQPDDEARLAVLLRLIREISPSPVLRLRDAGYYLGGFMFTEDHRFLATWPPLPDRVLATARTGGAEPLVARYTAQVEAELAKYTDRQLREQRIFWVALYDSPMYGALVTHYAVPIYRGDRRVAVMVVTIPFTQFGQLFQSSGHDPDFFVVSRDRKHLFGLSDANPREAQWTRAVLSATKLFESADARVQIVRKGLSFFVIQRVPGPDWIAVYAFDWRKILADLHDQLLLMATLMVVVLAILWAFIVMLDRAVLAPLRSRARQVYESEAFSRTVLNTAPVGLTVFDPHTGGIVMQNEIAESLLAASPDEGGFYQRLLGGRSRKRKTGSSPYDDVAEAAETAQGVRVAEASVASADGKRREISAAFSRARYQQREVVLFGLTDISRQKATQRLLQQARRAADEANEAKSVFVATMSHEIRTPLHGALGNLELLAMADLTPMQKERVTAVRRAFDALLALVNDVLDLSKVEAQELQLHFEPFRLEDVLERCAQTFAPVITGKGLHFLCLIDPRLAGTWSGDGHRIAQILMNLLGNARKFTETGTIALRAELREATGNRAWVRLSVADSGIGIPAAQQERIFEPFAQADRSIASRYGGTGLGLSLCRRLTDLMGGRIFVESIDGEGAVFTVDLPLVRERNDEEVPRALTEVAFDTVVIACERPAWQDTLAARIKHWFPGVRIVEARQDTALEPEYDQSIVVFGCRDDLIPDAWQEIHPLYVDTVVLSAGGPLYPERRDDAIRVTSLSAPMLRLALSACGKPDDALDGAPIAAPAPAAAEHREARILVAEDDPLNRTLLEHQLAALGYGHVDSVTDGKAALECCLAASYDVVVTDLGMPYMDGRELIAALRAKGIDWPVILNTAGSGDDRGAKSDGFADVLHKPVMIDRLRAALERVLGQSPPRAAALLAPQPAAPANAQMQGVFLATWPDDEAALRDAVANVDAAAFLSRLHRLKGALLVLNERDAIACCDAMRRDVEAYGMPAIQEQVMAFWDVMAQIVVRYRRNTEAVS
ncbi:response regulator [Trinickia terrae]|uniref:Virulence sensor protein BvgS n=1 Tax=Trinickia terrae TaxID=2571161 RepID=A0A4U1HGI4_9BURK|nr:ATP-binding protein [Trinickia terrae]TKC79073.1 response regulator [Trinickia terrae]